MADVDLSKVQWDPAPRVDLGRVKWDEPGPNPAMGGRTLQFGPLDTGIPIGQRAGQFLEGTGKGMSDFALGIGQVLGLIDPARVAEMRRLDRPLMETGAGVAGNIVGTMAAAAPTMAIPGANTVAGSAAIGAGLGAIAPVAEDESRIANAAFGGAGGAAGAGIAKAMTGGSILPVSKEARALMREGVQPTIGQAAGAKSMLGRIEQQMQSIPIIGQIIRGARDRATEEFDLAAIRRALPKDKAGQVTQAGYEAIRKTENVLSQGYDDVLDKIGSVRPDLDFARAVASVRNSPELALPDHLRDRLSAIVRENVLNRMQNGEIPADVAKRADAIFGSLARRFSGSSGDERAFGMALRDVQTAFRGVFARSAAPDDAAALQALNRDWANYLRVERAASMRGAKDGVFTASQLDAATRALDPSKGKRQYAQGRALMQDLSTRGESVLGNTVPDSGTAERLGNMLMFGSGGLGAANEYFGGPGFLTALAVSPLLYSRIGSRAMTSPLLPGTGAVASATQARSPYLTNLGRATGIQLEPQ